MQVCRPSACNRPVAGEKDAPVRRYDRSEDAHASQQERG